MKTWKLGSALILAALLCAACGGDNANTANANHTANKNEPAAAATNANAANTNAANTNASPTAILGAVSEGAALYGSHNCATCHGADGKGNATMKNIPNFTDAAWQKKATDDEMVKVISNGKPPMPAYSKQLTDAQIKSLIAYIRSLR